ncbi:hypothetical protein HPP92_022940 [Vanilla planifolia]|uniref:Uncharacterized protein n=1 Tax=Vanilla planifolia TaxID=51239 RepID=A0A835PYG2_VANPL|nr:hypothetical protein HPP92_022940 [Vanilla planifolia]
MEGASGSRAFKTLFVVLLAFLLVAAHQQLAEASGRYMRLYNCKPGAACPLHRRWPVGWPQTPLRPCLKSQQCRGGS